MDSFYRVAASITLQVLRVDHIYNYSIPICAYYQQVFENFISIVATTFHSGYRHCTQNISYCFSVFSIEVHIALSFRVLCEICWRQPNFTVLKLSGKQYQRALYVCVWQQITIVKSISCFLSRKGFSTARTRMI